jgi:3-methyladenine DNA glycosylase Tag
LTAVPPEDPPIARKPTPPADIPRVIAKPTLDDHLEVISRAVFQAGLNWAIITARWPAFRAAFDAFAVDRVAAYGEADVERIMEADGVVHSRGKITGTIANARALKSIVAEFGSIHAYASRFPSYDVLFADAHARFSYLGDLSCYYWLFRTGEAVPRFEQWMERQERDHPRMREMVTLAREAGGSPERSAP